MMRSEQRNVLHSRDARAMVTWLSSDGIDNHDSAEALPRQVFKRNLRFIWSERKALNSEFAVVLSVVQNGAGDLC